MADNFFLQKSYPRVKDFNVDLSQIKSPTKQQPSDLIFIGSDFFDDHQCSLKGLPARENSWFALIDLRNDCSSLDAILGVLKSARLINGTLLRGILFYVDEIPSAPSLNNLGNRSELHSAPLYALLLPREAVPLSVRRCSDTPNTTTACTVAISTSPEGTSPRSRFWIHRSPSSPPPSPSSTPSFPRHRVNASPPDHYSNQSSSDGTVGSTSGNGVSSGSGGVVNMEDAFLNRSSVLFVAVSFILLMFISLAWLVFYYVQRFRYLHSKERASRRLAELARKAVARIPLKLLQAGDKEIGANGEHCAICIEPYRPFDNIRILPCRQVIWFILYPLLFILQLVQVVPPSMAWRSLL
ncbi:RING finger protein [Echinococcus granulosus]|uniref:RING finger protein n=1 Tax=Echinococcus granulosus TaxID=6210 RepID=W6U8U5_ECHGR|nr:RING finger protein [Echinococcus granulosus]EUB57763.1 RING finger protein [Echinococcus granulosus]